MSISPGYFKFLEQVQMDRLLTLTMLKKKMSNERKNHVKLYKNGEITPKNNAQL